MLGKRLHLLSIIWKRSVSVASFHSSPVGWRLVTFEHLNVIAQLPNVSLSPAGGSLRGTWMPPRFDPSLLRLRPIHQLRRGKKPTEPERHWVVEEVFVFQSGPCHQVRAVGRVPRVYDRLCAPEPEVSLTDPPSSKSISRSSSWIFLRGRPHDLPNNLHPSGLGLSGVLHTYLPTYLPKLKPTRASR